MTWKPYNPTWLVELAKAQHPEEAWLVEALSLCTSYIQRGPAYLLFVDAAAPNQPGSLWQFERNLVLQDPRERELILDILKGDHVGGMEMLKYL